MADINDYGIKVGFPGVDVKTAPDHQLLYNSSWPTLSIHASPQISQDYGPTTSQGSTNAIYRHGLGYVPLFIPYAMSDFTFGGVPQYLEMGARQNIMADNQNIYFAGGFHTLGTTLNTAIMIFPIDIETAFLAPNIKTTLAGQIVVDRNYGIKATKQGKDYSSTDLRDFTIHSSTRGPLLHAVAPGTANSSGIYTYAHNLTYNPIFMAYQQVLGEPHKYVAINGYAGVSTAGSTITLRTTAGYNCSIVVLKDPVDPGDNVINVSL